MQGFQVLVLELWTLYAVGVRLLRFRLLRAGILLALGCLGFSATPGHASAQKGASPYRCSQGTGAEGGTLRVNQFTIEIKSEPGNEDAPCQAIIRSPKGDIVFQYGDWGIDVLSVTGKDVNGDGQPDAVLEGYSGGAHCCWTYSIVSLGRKPGLIRAFENRDDALFEDLKGNGRIEILVQDGTFDEFDRLAHPFSPFPLLILRLEGDRFKDVGAEFRSTYDKEIRKWRHEIKAPSEEKFFHSNPAEVHDETDYLETECRVLLVVLDYLYSERPKDAWKSLGELWPAKDRERIRNEMLQQYCNGLRAELEVGASPACKDLQ